MKKIEAAIPPHRLDEARDALLAVGAAGMSVTEVRSAGDHTRVGCYRGAAYEVSFSPHLRLEVVPDAVTWLPGCTRRRLRRYGERHRDARLEDVAHIRSGARGG